MTVSVAITVDNEEITINADRTNARLLIVGRVKSSTIKSLASGR